MIPASFLCNATHDEPGPQGRHMGATVEFHHKISWGNKYPTIL